MGSVTLYAGRATGTIYAGGSRPVYAGAPWFPNGFNSPSSPAAWGRSGGMCAPVTQCCCQGPINVAPGEIKSILLNWSPWIDDNPGYNLAKVASARLDDMTQGRPRPADPDVIKVTTGIPGEDPPVIDNADVASLVRVIPGNQAAGTAPGTQTIIDVSEDAQIGDQYKLTVCMWARDCNGSLIRQCDCVVLNIAEC